MPMRTLYALPVVGALAVLSLVGCKQEAAAPPTSAGHTHQHDHDHDHAGHSHTMTTKQAAQDTQAAAQEAAGAVTLAPPGSKPVNTTCPVGNEPINAEGILAVYQGKVYAFCCDMCYAGFKANPARYVKAE